MTVRQIEHNLGRLMLVCLVMACGALTWFSPGWSAPPKELTSGGYNDRPHIQYCSVLPRNTASGMQTALQVGVADPGGSVPTTISSVTVTGPDINYTFDPNIYPAGDYSGYGEYWHVIENTLPADGEYTFTAINNNGNSAISYFYLTKGQTIPLPDSSQFQASGDDPLSPTLSWVTIPGYPDNLFYRVQIYDTADTNNLLWYSGRTFNTTSVTVPGGVLSWGRSYIWRADVWDNNWSHSSNNRASGATIPPLVIDNTRAYFNGVAAVKVHNSDGSFATGVGVIGGDPSESVLSLVVTGPNGFLYAFDLEHDCADQSGSSLHICVHQVPGSVVDGNYTFALTNSAGTVESHFQLDSYEVPLIDSDSCRASGNPLAPVLSWTAPATVDRPLYYVVFIKDPNNNIVWQSSGNTMSSTGTAYTSITVPNNILKSGGSYQWQIVANDSRYWFGSNKSISSLKALAVDNSTPYFSYAVAYDGHDPDGHFTGLQVRVGDQNGTIPGSIASLTVDGPPGTFSYTFQPSDYLASDNEYFHRVSDPPPEGLYTFTVTKNNGHSAVTHWFHRVAGGAIPLLDESSFDVSGDPLAPTISWSTVAGYPHHLYYRARIINPQGKPVLYYIGTMSSWSSSYTVVPLGTLVAGVSYQYRVEAADSPDFPGYDNRANSSYLALPQLPTPAPPGQATLVSPSGYISNIKPIFRWDPVANSNRYYLSVNDSSGNKIKQWYTAAQAGCGDGAGFCSAAPGIALEIGSCSWSIQTENSGGAGLQSDPTLFTIVLHATVPGAPTVVTATAGNAQAAVSFTPPASNGGIPITLYTVTSIPGGITQTGASSPITLTGLTNGESYTFTVTATNAVGTGPASSASPPVTPSSGGSLKVTITPKGAVTAGARWKVDGGAWRAWREGALAKLSVGAHPVAFKEISGWVTPPGQTVNIVAGEVTSVTGTYQTIGADFTGTPVSGKASFKVKFTDQSTGPVKSWLWDFGDNSTSKVQNPTHTYSKPGTYTVTLTVKNGNCTSTKAKTDYITVYPVPKADFSAEPASGKRPLKVQFTDQSTGPVTSWSWDFGDNGTSKVQNPSHTYTKAGTYTVELTAKGPGGTNTSSKTGYIKVQR